MKFEDVKIGAKVIPFNKTIGSLGLDSSEMWKIASEAKQKFLYVVDIDKLKKQIVLNHCKDDKNGDLFSSDNFKKY